MEVQTVKKSDLQNLLTGYLKNKLFRIFNATYDFTIDSIGLRIDITVKYQNANEYEENFDSDFDFINNSIKELAVKLQQALKLHFLHCICRSKDYVEFNLFFSHEYNIVE